VTTQSRTADWYLSEGVEQASLGLLDSLLQPGQTVVDCGANVGVFAIAAALKVEEHGRVIAFEPNIGTLPLLRANLERHRVADRVAVEDRALGDTESVMSFKRYANDLVSGLFEAPSTSWPGELIDDVEVRVSPLDSIDLGSVDFMKIDVEGAEPQLLDGAQATLAANRDCLLLTEINPATLAAAGTSVDDLLDRFPRDRWSLWIVDDHLRAGHAPIDRFDRSDTRLSVNDTPGWYGNLLAAPVHREDEVQQAVDSINSRFLHLLTNAIG
jgi:FkbM family methyltransferase